MFRICTLRMATGRYLLKFNYAIVNFWVVIEAASRKTRRWSSPTARDFVVGVTRFELVTSSVSGKRSPPELNARSLVTRCWGCSKG